MTTETGIRRATAAGTLSRDQAARVRRAVSHSRSSSTRRAYRQQWNRFAAWMDRQGVKSPLPASAAHVAAYLADRAEDGVRPATLRQAASAIAQAHREAGQPNPCQSEGVKRALSGLARESGARPRQVAALTATNQAAIIATAPQRRDIGRGRLESPAAASRRARVDCALIGTMRDGLLRRSEAAALTWAEVEAAKDGSGRLTVARSKTDQLAEGATLYLSRPTMAALATIRQDAPGTALVFGLSSRQIARRIQAAAAAAGLEGRFAGHSCRVGMSVDLAAAGTEMAALMVAGRWASPRMPARYASAEIVGRGAIARYYRS